MLTDCHEKLAAPPHRRAAGDIQQRGDALHGLRVHVRGRPLLRDRQEGHRGVRVQRGRGQPLHQTDPSGG